MDIESSKVARLLAPGAEFQFTFRPGDDWIHRCVVGADKVDPVQVLVTTPPSPLPYWGWGSSPDQYGRRWADDDRAGLPMALQQRQDQAEPVTLSVVNRRTWRAGPGDEVLAEDLLACLRREPLTGRVVPVDLEILGSELEGGSKHVGRWLRRPAHRRGVRRQQH
ncbi:hypothetical protein JOJ86_006954 [Rhodococcus percolatus]|uniref:hypothetical protein n=1 Tax=Rhodococcus opacus TaxID=37919 RepID=UPI001844D077|nr:hypothetical protein [Rhodococcus opacus]MBA8962243.1 hypothetical protein [Rhodococcus opacus]MBP2209228.1 hypothetical protein [Rhodococcus opacus]